MVNPFPRRCSSRPFQRTGDRAATPVAGLRAARDARETERRSARWLAHQRRWRRSFERTARSATRVNTSTPAFRPPADGILLAMANGYVRTQLLCVAAKLGIADHLADGPRSADEIARATGTQA